MNSPNPADTTTKLTYVDHDGVPRVVAGCKLTVDHLDRHWIWSEQLEQNLVYRTKGRDNALIAAISLLLFIVQLRDERIAALQRIADLAYKFAAEVSPNENDD
jgi:hypothetical protein